MNTLSLKNTRFPLLSGVGALLLLLSGCSGDDGATGVTTGETSTTTDSTTSGSSTTSSATTSGTSTGTAGETSSSTSGDPSTSMGSTTEDPTAGTTGDPTEDPTGGVVDGMKSCEIACATIAECIGLPPELCVADCMEDFAMADSAECEAAKIAINVCLATLTCENVENQDLGDCEPLAKAEGDACGGGIEPPPVCEPSKMMMGNGCTHSFDCGDVVYGMKCNNQGCQCLVDGVTMGGCQNMSYCPLVGDEAKAAAAACCGFDL